jgi:predicted HicB family RNase H-like nuclease
MNTRIQIVGRIPRELSRRVRAAAKRRKVTLNAFVIAALAQAVVSPRRAAETKGA